MHCTLIISIVCLICLFITAESSPINYDSTKLLLRRRGVSADVIAQVKRNGRRYPVNAYQDRYPTSEDVTIKDDHSYQARVVCEPGKTSGWLQCENPSGDMDRSEAEQICQSHSQNLWMYVPTGPVLQYTYWICSKPVRS